MARQPPKRQCKHCRIFFDPDPRCVRRQRYCFPAACRKASKAASHQRWLHKAANRDYCKDSRHVERVRAWRQAHPGYWRCRSAATSQVLQDDSTAKLSQNQSLDASFRQDALQDDLLDNLQF